MKLDELTADLICDLEYLIGDSFYNPKSYNGWTGTEGLSYRYPVTFQRSAKGEDLRTDGRVQFAVHESVTPEMARSLKYKVGANQLFIGRGLISVLEELERRYGIDFNELEEKYKSENE